MKKLSIATLSLALLLGATACSTEGAPTATPTTTQPGVTAPPAPVSAPEPYTESPAATPTPTDDGIAKFGETWKYDDGVAMTVSKPQAGVSTESSTNPGAKLTVLTLTITNGGKTPLKPVGFATVTYGPEGVPAEQVYDSAQGLAENWPQTILPGKKATIKAAFAMPADSKDVTLTISPTFEHAEAIFVQ
jgi:hypothetical protein